MNPYRNRTLPTGRLNYPRNPKVLLNQRGKAELEYGEVEILYDLVKIVGGGNICNLGTARGGSAVAMAQCLRDHKIDGHVWTVDCQDDEGYWRGVKTALRVKGTKERITFLQMTTEEAARRFEKEKKKFNLIFIDADHSYRGVMLDWIWYSNMLTKDGLIAFHDTNQDYTDRVIRELVLPEFWEMTHWVNRIKVFKHARQKKSSKT